MGQAPDLRLRTAFWLSIADVFFGAIGVLIVIIVLSSQQTEDRVLEEYDIAVVCQTDETGNHQLLIDETAQLQPIPDWIKEIPTDRLFYKIGVSLEDSSMDCIAQLNAETRAHNAKLAKRGTVAAVLGVTLFSRPAQD